MKQEPYIDVRFLSPTSLELHPVSHVFKELENATMQFSQSTVASSTALGELKSGLQLIYGKQLKGVYLFGSYARGEAEQESDLDMLVVLEGFDRYAHEVNRTGALAADLSIKYEVSVSLVFLREHEWLQGDTPFLSNVRDEAILA